MNLHRLCMVLILLSILMIPVRAQESVSDDAVNEVAEKMYCPVCENIPLDDCGTPTCYQWKEEIRQQLAEGISEEAIIQGFVERFGDHVMGTPQDPILRTLSLVTPWILIGFAVIVGVMTFSRWRKHETIVEKSATTASQETVTDDEYRARLEADLQKRR